MKIKTKYIRLCLSVVIYRYELFIDMNLRVGACGTIWIMDKTSKLRGIAINLSNLLWCI